MFIMNLVYLMLLLLIYCSEITENTANKTGNAQELAAIKIHWKTQLNETLPIKQAIKKPQPSINTGKTHRAPRYTGDEMNAWVKEVKTQIVTCFGYTCVTLYVCILFVGIIVLIILAMRPELGDAYL